VRAGRFTRIPERAEDLAVLWSEAAPLTPETIPPWGAGGIALRYRYLGSAAATGLSGVERESLVEELELLERAGLAIDVDERDPHTYRLYAPGPATSAVWSIGLLVGDSPVALSDPRNVKNPVLTSRDVTDVPAAYVADPFILRREGAWFMFFEIMNWRLGRGQIGLAESADGIDWKYRCVVLTEPFHLSYPYVFGWNGRCYMVPESRQAGAVRLYEAVAFPTLWSHVATLLEGEHLADASVARHRDTWWLFVETSSGERNDTLGLYYADDLAGPWAEHPLSPIVRGDSRFARPAGRVIGFGDTIIRYAQDCSSSYGREVYAFEITELTRTHYEERRISAGPILRGSGADWNAQGMHHVDPHPLEEGRWLASVDGWTMESGWAEIGDPKADMERGLIARDIEGTVPPGALFLLVDKGRGLVTTGGRHCLPFPEEDGGWAGYPADAHAAIVELERLRGKGAEFIVFPASMLYWLDAYPDLERHLFDTARRVLSNDRVSIFDLRRVAHRLRHLITI